MILYPIASDFQLWSLTIGIKCLYFKNVIGCSSKIDRFKCKAAFEYEGLVFIFVLLSSIINSPLGDNEVFLFKDVCFVRKFCRWICVILILLSWLPVLTFLLYWFHSTKWVFFSWMPLFLTILIILKHRVYAGIALD